MALLDQVVAFRPVMDQPIGKAAAFSAGFGLSRGLSGILNRIVKVDPKFAAMLLAILAKLDAVQNTIGRDWSELIATTAWIDAITQMTGVTTAVQSVFSPIGASEGIFVRLLKGVGLGAGMLDVEPDFGQVEMMEEEPQLTSLEAKLAAIAG